MKKKYLIFIITGLSLIIIVSLFIFFNRKNINDENTLYTINFENIKLRIERYDYSLGQNQIVGVERSVNNGNYESITKEPLIVSMEPKFVFLNKNLGFVISKSNLTKTNNYLGIKVTSDGGITFSNGIINYDNPNIEVLTIEDVPYYENDLLKLSCSIYQIREDKNGYETKNLTFVSTDNGLTWNLELQSD